MLHHSQPTGLIVAVIVLLRHFFAQLHIQEHFCSEAVHGTGVHHDYMLLPQKKQQQQKKKKKVIFTLSDHVSSVL